MDYIDLHTHSKASDGTLSPEELIRYAAQKGLRAIALTDHDTTDGLADADAAAARCGVELVRGIEFSTDFEGKDIHMLGFDIRPDTPSFRQALSDFRHNRTVRNTRMADLLREKHGFDISPEQLTARFPDAIMTRAHYGRYLLEKGYVSSMKEAFDRYIGDTGSCYVPKDRMPAPRAVELILEAGGIPVLAHPLLYHLEEEKLESLIRLLKEHGLTGLEAIYSCNRGSDENNMRRLARIFGLKLSGGSDFHGSIKPHIELGSGMGNLKIPYEILEELRA